MKKLKKRLLAVALTAAATAAMAMPSFADYTNGLNGFESHYQSYNGQSGCGYLNAYPLNNAGVQRGTPLRIWSYSTSGDQSFKGSWSTGGYLVLKLKTAPTGGTNYSLMVNRSSSNGNAILWSGSDAYFDSNLKCTGSNAGGFRFELANYSGEYLNAKGNTNGSIINFQKNVGAQTSAKWHSR